MARAERTPTADALPFLPPTMAYQDSYLWRLRQAVGSDLVLMPGAMVALQRDDRRVLLTKRADDGTWCLPASAASVSARRKRWLRSNVGRARQSSGASGADQV